MFSLTKFAQDRRMNVIQDTIAYIHDEPAKSNRPILAAPLILFYREVVRLGMPVPKLFPVN